MCESTFLCYCWNCHSDLWPVRWLKILVCWKLAWSRKCLLFFNKTEIKSIIDDMYQVFIYLLISNNVIQKESKFKCNVCFFLPFIGFWPWNFVKLTIFQVFLWDLYEFQLCFGVDTSIHFVDTYRNYDYAL